MENITVILPTYRRSGPLAWAVTSILRQRFDGAPVRRRRLVVLNNDLNKEPVILAIGNVRKEVGDNGWEVQLRHREPPVSAIDNMYNGILEFADEGDVVFLHGDDDIMTPNSLALRAKMFARTPELEILLARCSSGMLFSAGDTAQNTRVRFQGLRPEPAVEEAERRVGLADLCHIGFILISCQAYRNNARFRAMLARARAFLEQLPGTGSSRQGMLPQFLPVLAARESMVYATETLVCLRGEFAEDVIRKRPDSAYWSATGLYLLTATELKDEPALEPMRREYVRQTLRWAIFSLKREDFRELVRLTGLKRWCATAEGWKAVLVGLKNYLLQGLHLNALRVRLWRRFGAGEGWSEVFAKY
jgi:hypothetical protein